MRKSTGRKDDETRTMRRDDGPVNPDADAFLCSRGLAEAETLVIDGGTVHPVTGDPFVGRVVIEDGP